MAIVNNHYEFCAKRAAPLPELAGEWVLNEILYAPVPGINEKVKFQTYLGTVNSVGINATNYPDYLRLYKSSGANTVYKFSTNEWIDKIKIWTFPEGATASDEFRAWLASNATKQS